MNVYQTIQAMRTNERGNVAMVFALSLVPLLGFIGAGVDYSRVNAAQSSMQVALDSAALMVSRDIGANPNMSLAEVKANSQKYFNALYTGKLAGTVTVNATYATNTADGSTVTLTGASSVATDFMRMVGLPQMGIKGSSTTTWGMTRMRVAMALDVTGSMASAGKLDAMKTAAKDLVTTLNAVSRMTEDVYISVVPFAQMVNVGPDNKNENWLRWDQLGGCSDGFSLSKEACQAANRNWSSYSSSNANKNAWKGCVEDRAEPYDTTRDQPQGNATRYPAMYYVQNSSESCPSELLPMTSTYGSNNVQLIKNKIDSLEAAGGTNQLIGMVWAWNTLLVGGDIFPAPAKDSTYNYNDVIIVLSDGMNTGSRMYGRGTDWTTAIDDRQKILCDNMKAKVGGKQQTTIYTIQVNTDGDPESAVLKYCADAGNFYPTSSASGISAAFTAIGNSLNKLRVAK